MYQATNPILVFNFTRTTHTFILAIGICMGKGLIVGGDLLVALGLLGILLNTYSIRLDYCRFLKLHVQSNLY